MTLSYRNSVYGRELTLSSGNECPTGHIPMVLWLTLSLKVHCTRVHAAGHKCLSA